jgi:hypothetical protein
MVQLGAIGHSSMHFAEHPVPGGSVQYRTGSDEQARFSAPNRL